MQLRVSSPHTSYIEPGLCTLWFQHSMAWSKPKNQSATFPTNKAPENGGCPRCRFTNTVPAITVLSTAPKIHGHLRKQCGHHIGSGMALPELQLCFRAFAVSKPLLSVPISYQWNPPKQVYRSRQKDAADYYDWGILLPELLSTHS